jgi:hypothetical protein
VSDKGVLGGADSTRDLVGSVRMGPPSTRAAKESAHTPSALSKSFASK